MKPAKRPNASNCSNLQNRSPVPQVAPLRSMKRSLSIFLLLALASPLLTAAIIQYPEDYHNLQLAVNAAAPGDTIQIAAGTHAVAVTITKPLTIQGVGMDETILTTVPSRSNVISFLLPPADNAGFVLKDLTIRREKENQSYGGLLSVVKASPFILQNVRVDNSPITGAVYIDQSLLQAKNVNITSGESPALNLNTLIQGSTIDDLELKIANTGYAIETPLWVQGSSQVELSNVTFSPLEAKKLAQITGNLSRVNLTNAGIPNDKVVYYEGARPDGPTPEIVKIMEEEANYGMPRPNYGGPGENAEFLAKMEPKRRELARAYQKSISKDKEQKNVTRALIQYVNGLIEDIEYGPTDFAADPAIQTEIKQFEATFGADATSALIKKLPPHPETNAYRLDHAYYTQFVSPDARDPLNKAAEGKMLANVHSLIQTNIIEWPNDSSIEVTAKGFSKSISKIEYEIRNLRFPYDHKAAHASIRAMAFDAISQKLDEFDVEVVRAIQDSGLPMITIGKLSELIEAKRAAELQATALVETRIDSGPSTLTTSIWKSPDGEYMITCDSDGTYLYDARSMLRLQTIKDSKDKPIYLSNSPIYQAHANRVLLPLASSIATFDLDIRRIVDTTGTSGKPLAYYSKSSKASYSLAEIYGSPFSNLSFSRFNPSPKVSPEYVIPVSNKKKHYPALIHEFNPKQIVVQYHDRQLMSAFIGTFDASKDTKLQEVKTDLGRLVSIEDGTLLAIKDTEVRSNGKGITYTTVEINHLANDPSLRIEKTVTVKLPYHHAKYATQLHFATNAQTKQIAIADVNLIAIINYETGAVNGMIPDSSLGSNVSTGAVWIEDVNNVLLSYNSTGQDAIKRSHFARFDIASGKHIADIGKPAHYPNQLFADSQQSDLYTLNKVGTLKRVRVNPNGFTIKTVQSAVSAFAINDESGLIAYANHGQNTVMLTDRDSILDGQDELPIDSTAPRSTIDSLFFSQDGSMLGIRTPQKFYALSVDSGEVVFEMTFTQAHGLVAQNPGFFSPDGSITVISQYKASSFDKGYDIEKWIAFDTETGDELWESSARGGNFAGLDSTGTKAFISRGTAHKVIDIKTGKGVGSTGTNRNSTTRTWATATTDGARLATSNGTDTIIVGTQSSHVIKNNNNQVQLTNRLMLKNDGASINALAFLADSNFLAATDRDGFIRIWDLSKEKLMTKVALFENDADWAIATADNRFDTAPTANDLIYFVAGKELLETDALFEAYYTPKLLPTLLSGSTLEPVPEINNRTVPPAVKLGLAAGSRGLYVEDDEALTESDVATVRLKAEAFSMNSTISEIRLYHNEKLITTATRGLFVEDDILAENQAKTKEYTVNLLPGENTFVARAFDTNRLEGRSKAFTIKAAESSVPTKQKGGLNLHVLAVGIDSYTNSKYDLNYAVTDATAFLKKIEGINQNLFTTITPYFISNHGATSQSILKAFETVKQNSTARDVFIFYYAGHGVMTQSENKQFYLVPTDVTQLYGDDRQLEEKAISSQQLLELSKDIPAQKQLFILDACQSAGALEGIAMRGAAEEKAIAQLARSTGTHWLTASGSEQFATEFSELGHGAFTYTLLQGLEGSADTGDKRISVNELKAYLESEVPEVTAKHKGTPQYPSSYGYGNDFPIGALAQ